MISSTNKARLGDLLQDFAARTPDRRAFVCLGEGNVEAEVLTYGELDRRARTVAAKLHEVAKAGDRILLIFPTCLSFVTAFFACAYAGMIAVPVVSPQSRRLRSSTISIALDCQPAIALTISGYLEMAHQQFAGVSGLEKLRTLAIDQFATDAAVDFSPLQRGGESLAFLQYTSGSTSSPKGVMISEHNILANLEMMKVAFENNADDTYLGWAPLFHDMGLIANLLEPFYIGALCVLMPPAIFAQRPWLWLKAISHYQARVSGGPNFAFDLCIERSEKILQHDFDLSCWRIAFNSAEPVRADTIENFSRLFAPRGFRRESFLPCYGMADATLLVSGGPPQRPPTIKPISKIELSRGFGIPPSSAADQMLAVGCGRALAGEQILIVDPKSLMPLEDGEIGEIWVGGRHIPRGYWGKPVMSEEVFHAPLATAAAGRFLRTGDLGFVIGGELFIAGRIKDVMIVRGHNYYPQDIERMAETTHPSLRKGSSAAFVVAESGRQEIVLVQEVERTHRRSFDYWQAVAAIRQAVHEEFELTLTKVILVQPGSIPKTSSGKIKRAETRQLYLAGALEQIGSNAATGT